MPATPSTRLAATLLVLGPLLTACGAPPRTQQPLVIQGPPIPALPPEARQPPAPDWCLPTCSAALTTERESWRRRLTRREQPASPASAPTTQ